MKSLNIKLFLLGSLMAGLLVTWSSCNKEEDQADLDFLVFGSIHGFCIGEQCVEIFRLDNGKLMEDTLDIYPSGEQFYSGDFIELSEDQYQSVKGLLTTFPVQLLEEDKVRFGCADCADQGGYYIEAKMGNLHQFWLMDKDKSQLPGYLHEFIDLVDEKIELLKN